MSFRRWVAVVLGLGLLAGGFGLGIGPYRDLQAFEKAGYCGTPSPPAGRDCIAKAQVTVVSRSTYTTHDTDTGPDPNWPPPPPPIPQPPVLPLRIARTVTAVTWPPGTAAVPVIVAAAETTHYKVTVRAADGRRHTYEVSAALYNAATSGATAQADLWHGRVTRLTLGAESTELGTGSGFTRAWLIGWAGVMLLVWAFSAGAVFTGIVVWCWWMGFVVYQMASSWGPAWYVVPLLIAGSLLAWRIREAVLERRRALRYANFHR